MPARLNIPPITRAVLITLVSQSFLSAVIRYRQWTEHANIVIPYLTLVPQLSIIYPWTFITATLVEGNVFTLGIAAATIYYGGRYLERAWSSRELAKFLALVALIPNLLTFLVLIIFFTLTRNESWTYVSAASPSPILVPFWLTPYSAGLPSSLERYPSRAPSSSRSVSSSPRTP